MLGIGIYMFVADFYSTSIVTGCRCNPSEQTISWQTPVFGAIVILILGILIKIDKPKFPKMDIQGKRTFVFEKITDCRNKNVINAIEKFGGSEVYDSQSSHAQNIYLGRIILFAIGLFVLFALLSCNNRHDLTENYSVFTYGEGLYGESEEDYPVFVSKLGYKDAPPFIANVRQVWWNDSTIIIGQNNDYWWIVTAVDNRLSYGDKYVGPLSVREKDSIMVAEKIRIKQMKHWSYE